ncbi:hypothetical protein GQ44DRAFT_771300 [Phaeosphaeriaceae sp. PMI808]|nr:hypothetical protein GQ44DRAFT_771300 [Phaeosphaeriaceae sp. PMI808]
MVKQTVSIVGAGLGGLTLSRCLQQRGIPTILYERTPSPAQHNYGITVQPSAYAPLLKIFNVNEKAFRSGVAVDAAIGGSGKVGVGPSDALYAPNRALSAATDIPEQFFREMAMLCQTDMPQLLIKIFEEAELRQDGILHRLMRTVLVKKEEFSTLAQGGIVLMGDAARATPIIGGSGANAAISDAPSPSSQIEQGGTGGIQDWVNDQHSTIEASVLIAEKKLRCFTPIHHSVYNTRSDHE